MKMPMPMPMSMSMSKSKSPLPAAAVLAAAVLAVLSGRGSAEPNAPNAPDSPNPAAQSPVEWGKYLVSMIGCNDCHTPWKLGPNGPEPDMSRMLSGHPEALKMPPPPKPVSPWTASIAGTFTVFAGPWGVSYVPNITPDRNTGIGIWTEDMFVKAIKTGKHMGTSREILPPMPWPSYRNMSDADLKAIFAYLRSIPPIANRVPDSEPAPPPPGAPAK